MGVAECGEGCSERWVSGCGSVVSGVVRGVG